MAFEAEFILWAFIHSFLESVSFPDGEKSVGVGGEPMGVGCSPSSLACVGRQLLLLYIQSVRRCVIQTGSLTRALPHHCSLLSIPAFSSSSRDHGHLQPAPLVAARLMFFHTSICPAWHRLHSQFPFPKIGLHSHHFHTQECIFSPPPCLKVGGV